ncbi:MAG: type II toxin-antitoxin system Phd/YefM family antitoxin [Pseudonocardiaceae bacterium]
MKLTATVASKEFSDVLSRVAAGEVIEIERHGHTVAVIVPPPRGLLAGSDLLDLFERLPVCDEKFSSDVASLGEVLQPPVVPWQS